MGAHGSHFRMITGGPVINADSFQMSTVLDEDGVFTNSTVLVKTSCTDDGLMGWGIWLLGFCNPQKSLVVTGTMAGKSVNYPAGTLPSKVQNVSQFLVGGILEITVTAHVTLDPPLKASDHLVHLTIIDESKGQVLVLDYVKQTKVLTDTGDNIA